mmetsp:Transcript_26701/g.59109  ORF Transcript_26701/g.59109 Transcript_26701/m.59109 type:complete len:268 (+) Transcript_26701:728-1531(+)
MASPDWYTGTVGAVGAVAVTTPAAAAPASAPLPKSVSKSFAAVSLSPAPVHAPAPICSSCPSHPPPIPPAVSAPATPGVSTPTSPSPCCPTSSSITGGQGRGAGAGPPLRGKHSCCRARSTQSRVAALSLSKPAVRPALKAFGVWSMSCCATPLRTSISAVTMLSSPSTLGTAIQSGSIRQGGGASRARFTATRSAAASRAAPSWRTKRSEELFCPPLPVPSRERRRLEHPRAEGSWLIQADALSKAHKNWSPTHSLLQSKREDVDV